jgi:phospholipid transport system transporter-binding protein
VTQVTKPAAELKAVDSSHFVVTGVLGFDTVKSLLETSRTQFAGAAEQLEVDLAGVTQSDSAGLALLIEWLKFAGQAGKRIRFTRAPDQLRSLARISELEEILPIGG